MVGLSNMETAYRRNCASCGTGTGVTKCDKCSLMTCSKCAVVVPNSKERSLIKILHYKCAPISHRKIVDLSRGEHK